MDVTINKNRNRSKTVAVACTISLVVMASMWNYWYSATTSTEVIKLRDKEATSTTPSTKIVDQVGQNTPRASGSPSFNTMALVEYMEADIIIVGKLDSVVLPSEASSQAVQTTNSKFQASIEVQAVYKGDVRSAKRLRVHYQSPDALIGFRWSKPATDELRLYFLKLEPDGNIGFFRPIYSSFPVLHERPAVDKPITPKDAVEIELLNNIQRGDEMLVVRSLSILWRSLKAIEICKNKLAQSQLLTIKSAAVAYRLRCQDAEALDEAIEIIEETQRTPLPLVGPSSQGAIVQTVTLELPSLAAEISVEQLMRLLILGQDEDQKRPWADFPAVEFAVSEVLRQIAVGEVSRDKAKFVPVALDLLKSGKNLDAQYNAFTLLVNLRPGPGPTWEELRSDPAKYFKEYYDWWEQDGQVKS